MGMGLPSAMRVQESSQPGNQIDNQLPKMEAQIITGVAWEMTLREGMKVAHPFALAAQIATGQHAKRCSVMCRGARLGLRHRAHER
jgi:hypothetical protein